MDAQKASYSITLMANVLGVTRAGYYAWKNRAPQRGKRASARRRLDEAVAWEHEVSGGTYGAPRIRHALTRAGVDVGVRAIAASMRRQGLTGLNTHPRPARRGRRGRWPMRITAPASGTKAPWTGCGSRTLPTCAAPKAGSTCAPCAMRTRVECSDTPWASSTTHALVITALDMAATTRGAFPAGVVLHADRGTQFTSQKLAAYITHWNTTRRQVKLKGLTPAEYRDQALQEAA